MTEYNTFLEMIGSIKYEDIPSSYKCQFKLKDNFININSRNFETIMTKYSL